MARLIRIQRALRWIATSLSANRDANPIPSGYVDQILLTLDSFGTDRLADVQIETVDDTIGSIEIVHSQVPAGRVRYYSSMEYSHNDVGVPHRLRPGQVIPTPAGFPFASFRDEILAPDGDFLATDPFWLGPLARAAVRADAMGLGARMRITPVWIEMALGEYHQMRR